jgi:hypothetical protein
MQTIFIIFYGISLFFFFLGASTGSATERQQAQPPDDKKARASKRNSGFKTYITKNFYAFFNAAFSSGTTLKASPIIP